MDEIIVIGDYEDEIVRLEQVLAREFEIKDLSQLKYFLGVEIARNKRGLSISHKKIYTWSFETRMIGCKPTETPVEPYKKLRQTNKGDPVEARRKIGLSLHTKPDIRFSVSTISQYMHSPYEY